MKRKVFGQLSVIFGILAISYGFISLVLTLIEAFILKLKIEPEILEFEFDYFDYYQQWFNVSILFMPVVVVIGIIYVLGGIRFNKDKCGKTFLLKIAAILNLTVYLMYLVFFKIYLLPALKDYSWFFGLKTLNPLVVIGYSAGIIAILGFPAFVLVYINKYKKGLKK